MTLITPGTPSIGAKIREYTDRFEELRAFDPSSAVDMQAYGIPRRLVFFRLVQARVIVETEGSKYYLDHERLLQYNKRRRWRVAIVVTLVMIVTAILILAELNLIIVPFLKTH